MALAWHLVAGLGLLLLMLHLHPPPPPRRQLGMDASVPAVLLVGGGEGMGALEDTVAQLDKELGSSAQVVVVCGRNQKLQERLQARPQGGKHLKVIATGEPRAGALPSACMLAGAWSGVAWTWRAGAARGSEGQGQVPLPAGGVRAGCVSHGTRRGTYCHSRGPPHHTMRAAHSRQHARTEHGPSIPPA